MQQLINTEEEDRSVQLFTGETYNSLTKVVSEVLIQQLNQQMVRMKVPLFCP